MHFRTRSSQPGRPVALSALVSMEMIFPVGGGGSAQLPHNASVSVVESIQRDTSQGQCCLGSARPMLQPTQLYPGQRVHVSAYFLLESRTSCRLYATHFS